jgi:hypothetical protein
MLGHLLNERDRTVRAVNWIEEFQRIAREGCIHLRLYDSIQLVNHASPITMQDAHEGRAAPLEGTDEHAALRAHQGHARCDGPAGHVNTSDVQQVAEGCNQRQAKGASRPFDSIY